jgi:hypothetical protein
LVRPPRASSCDRHPQRGHEYPVADSSLDRWWNVSAVAFEGNLAC